nr:hypothetical protein [Clostridium botulinum]
MIHSPETGDDIKISPIWSFYAGKRIINTLQFYSYVKLNGGGYANYNGAPGLNLIIRDFSSDIGGVLAWVDSDTGVSWSFALNPPNSDYTKLYKNTSKVITKRNGGYTFSKRLHIR